MRQLKSSGGLTEVRETVQDDPLVATRSISAIPGYSNSLV